MSLTSAIATAQTIFSNTGLQSSALATNIANASNPDYARRVGSLTIDSAGGQKLSIDRTYDNGLVKQTMYSTADSSAQDTLQEKLERIRSLLGGNDYETSPSTYIATLRDNLQAYATKPNESTLASTVISGAQDVANSLNNISSEIQSMRGGIDQEITNQINTLNGLLVQFDDVNGTIKAGTATGADINNELDMRERYLKQISQIIGVRSFTRADNDMVLYTSDGSMLYDSGARKILFTPQPAYDASTDGNPIVIDGIPLQAGDSGNSTAKGSLQALLQVRDTIIPTYQSQLDETARGLITMFAQTDQTASGVDPIPGLFTYSGYAAGDTLPAAGTIVNGLSAVIKVNDSLIKNKGGEPTLLRDGGYDVDGLGVASTDYLANPDGDAGYSGLLDQYVQKFDDDQPFDEDTLLDASATIADFATGSVGWLEQYISESAAAKDNKTAQLSRVTEALSNTTGVSLDEEMSLMLDLEQSYKASSKLVSAVDQMMQSLLDSVGA
jgi:flagellar hook-associated protein 1 FlgK